MMKIAVVSAILEEPELVQERFNHVVSKFQGIVKGRMGIPFEEEGLAIISLTVVASLDEINNLTGRLGNIDHVIVKTAISKKEI